MALSVQRRKIGPIGAWNDANLLAHAQLSGQLLDLLEIPSVVGSTYQDERMLFAQTARKHTVCANQSGEVLVTIEVGDTQDKTIAQAKSRENSVVALMVDCVW